MNKRAVSMEHTTSKENGERVQVSSSATGGNEGALDDLIGNKVGSRSRTITQQGSTGSTEDRGHTALLVQGTGNIDGSVVKLVGTRALGLIGCWRVEWFVLLSEQFPIFSAGRKKAKDVAR
jgi:hypothetical protein